MTTRAAPEQLPEAATSGPTAVLAVACDVAAIGLLSFLMFSRIYYRELHMSLGFGWDRMALIAPAAGFMVLRRLSVRLGPAYARRLGGQFQCRSDRLSADGDRCCGCNREWRAHD
jgi:hypothetical protein